MSMQAYVEQISEQISSYTRRRRIALVLFVSGFVLFVAASAFTIWTIPESRGDSLLLLSVLSATMYVPWLASAAILWRAQKLLPAFEDRILCRVSRARRSLEAYSKSNDKVHRNNVLAELRRVHDRLLGFWSFSDAKLVSRNISPKIELVSKGILRIIDSVQSENPEHLYSVMNFLERFSTYLVDPDIERLERLANSVSALPDLPETPVTRFRDIYIRSKAVRGIIALTGSVATWIIVFIGGATWLGVNRDISFLAATTVTVFVFGFLFTQLPASR